MEPRKIPFVDVAALHLELADDLDHAWHRAVRDSAFIGGEAVEIFEASWASYCGTAHAVGVNSGTDALWLTLRALGIGRGDEVIVPANSFVATAEAVVLAGATPRFVDVDPHTLLVTPQTVSAAVGPATAAVIVVHLFGGLPDMAGLSTVAATAGIALIEDAAQAHGATWNGTRAGSFGVAGGFSFYPGKNLGAFGDAGAVVTDDATLAATVRSLGDHGRDLGHRQRHVLPGVNSRLDALQAAILSVKLPRLDAWAQRRRAAVQAYAKRTVDLPIDHLELEPGTMSAHHLAPIRIAHRDSTAASLARQGVETGIHYAVPCHLQAAFDQFRLDPLPVCEAAADTLLSLPLHPHLGDDEIDVVCEALRQSVRTPAA
jgi:dTDP-4-amino-4,6-dideoxygalactose transaminase